MPSAPRASPTRSSWTSKDALLYAVGVGAGQEPLDELQFTTENSADIDQKVLPTMAVVLGVGGGAFGKIGTFNPAMLVHGEQSIELHREIPVAGEVETVSEITGIYDKGKGAVVVRSMSTLVDAWIGDRRAAVHQDDVGVHPRRGRLGRRPRPVRRLGRSPTATPTSRSPTPPGPSRP